MAHRFSNSFHTVVLSASISRKLRLTLKDFRACAEAEYAALLEESGTVLLESGTLPPDQSAIVGALANGAFIAVRELASRLGDDCCEGLYHQGRTKHFSIIPLSPITTLITVFGNETKLGIVRSAAARYGPQLRDQLTDTAVGPPETSAPVPAFKPQETLDEGDFHFGVPTSAMSAMSALEPLAEAAPPMFMASPPEAHAPYAPAFEPYVPVAESGFDAAAIFHESLPASHTAMASHEMAAPAPVAASVAGTETQDHTAPVTFSPFLPLPPLPS
jgi:predicted regulator of Ras-like GTPase activity (Roadblock/LC7/MglB family)